ncbi:MAG: ThuA domain-containing protein [Candidatus Poribacteria bacterium]
MAKNNEQWVVYEGKEGLGKGKHVVFVSGDEEYRSEEALTCLAKIMAVRHGFKCTVLFAIDPETGEIDPVNQTNIPGLESLETADMMVLALRFRELPDDQMKYIIDYTNAGKPVMGLRTATHSFNYTRNKESKYAKYDFRSPSFEGGYGRQVLGETWVNHHGHHGVESTRGIINDEFKNHPILKGVDDIWGPTDVYTVTTITGNPKVLVFGEVLKSMDPKDEPNNDKPRMPLAWIKRYTGELGKTSRVFCTTMGASVDLQSAGLRRLLVNGCYWCMGMKDAIPEKSNVDLVGEYNPLYFGFGTHKKGVKPVDLKL